MSQFARRLGRPDRKGTPADLLVVGLGNPGEQFEGTRHNVGAAVVEELAARADTRLRKTKARALAAGVLMNGKRVVLAFPQTFMNNSGEAVKLLVQSYGIQEAHHIIVVHDELDLPPGEVKMKFGGGHAGHNGLRDIVAKLGSADFWRLRLGIGHPRDSAIPQQDVADYVLQPPRANESEAIAHAIDRALDAWPQIAAGDFERAMMALHTRREQEPK